MLGDIKNLTNSYTWFCYVYILIYFVQVANKTQQLQVDRTNAIFEVYTDRIIVKTQNCDKALLWILSQELSEFSVSFTCMHVYVHSYIHLSCMY